VVKDDPINIQLHKRVIKFIIKCVRSQNENVKLCTQLALNGSKSNMCNNINLLCQTYKINKYEIGNISKYEYIKTMKKCYYNESYHCIGNLINDLVNSRDKKDVSFLNIREITESIEELCLM